MPMQETALSEKDTDAELQTSVNGANETDLPPAEAADEFPHGGRLVVIMAALCSAMFLTALDQVSTRRGYPTCLMSWLLG